MLAAITQRNRYVRGAQAFPETAAGNSILTGAAKSCGRKRAVVPKLDRTDWGLEISPVHKHATSRSICCDGLEAFANLQLLLFLQSHLFECSRVVHALRSMIWKGVAFNNKAITPLNPSNCG